MAKHQRQCSTCQFHTYLNGQKCTNSESSYYNQTVYYYTKGRACHSAVQQSTKSNKKIEYQTEYCNIKLANGKVTVALSYVGDLTPGNKKILQDDLNHAFEVVELAAPKLLDTSTKHAESVEI